MDTFYQHDVDRIVAFLESIRKSIEEELELQDTLSLTEPAATGKSGSASCILHNKPSEDPDGVCDEDDDDDSDSNGGSGSESVQSSLNDDWVPPPHIGPATTLDIVVSLVRWICKRVSDEWMAMIMASTWPLVWGEKNMRAVHYLTLKPCPKRDDNKLIMHIFDEKRRCTKCSKQLCKDCEYCLLKLCKRSSEEAILQSSRKDSLAARRLYAISDLSEFSEERIRTRFDCTCVPHLSNSEHSCETGEFHFCRSCIERLHQGLIVENTSTFKIQEYSMEGESDKMLEDYMQPGGERRDWEEQLRCRLCHGISKTYMLDNGPLRPIEMHGTKIMHGAGIWMAEDRSEEYVDNWFCPWFFRTGQDTVVGKRKRACNGDQTPKQHKID